MFQVLKFRLVFNFIHKLVFNKIKRLFRNETMVISIVDQFKDMKNIDIAREKVGERIFVGTSKL